MLSDIDSLKSEPFRQLKRKSKDNLKTKSQPQFTRSRTNKKKKKNNNNTNWIKRK